MSASRTLRSTKSHVERPKNEEQLLNRFKVPAAKQAQTSM